MTGQWQLGNKLRVALGNYFEIYRLNAQIEDPAILATYAASGLSAAAPVALVTRAIQYSHYDPHFGLEWRASPNLSFRANAGSSITQPYAGLVSGFGSISIPNAAAHNYTNTIPNFSLQPETTVSYNLGLDNRFRDGSVFSMDLYDLTVHNVFLSNSTILPVGRQPAAGARRDPDLRGHVVHQLEPDQRADPAQLRTRSCSCRGSRRSASGTTSRRRCSARTTTSCR